jgi:hypothetical protein
MTDRKEREGYHDPFAGIGGAAPARSALTLRIVLAGSGLLLCSAGAVVLWVAEAPVVFSRSPLPFSRRWPWSTSPSFIRRKLHGEPG